MLYGPAAHRAISVFNHLLLGGLLGGGAGLASSFFMRDREGKRHPWRNLFLGGLLGAGAGGLYGGLRKLGQSNFMGISDQDRALHTAGVGAAGDISNYGPYVINPDTYPTTAEKLEAASFIRGLGDTASGIGSTIEQLSPHIRRALSTINGLLLGGALGGGAGLASGLLLKDREGKRHPWRNLFLGGKSPYAEPPMTPSARVRHWAEKQAEALSLEKMFVDRRVFRSTLRCNTTPALQTLEKSAVGEARRAKSHSRAAATASSQPRARGSVRPWRTALLDTADAGNPTLLPQ
jgi:hypothetical protein